MRVAMALVLLSSFFMVGCANIGSYPQQNVTTVDLSEGNYDVVKTSAIGESNGFNLLGIIPFSSPTHSGAMTDLWRKAGYDSGGGALALANVTQDRSTTYLILFSLPKLTIRADIVEFDK